MIYNIYMACSHLLSCPEGVPQSVLGGPHGPGPNGPPWALMGRALVASLGPCGLGPCGPPWLLLGRALVGPPLGPCGPGPCGPPWTLMARALVGILGPHGPGNYGPHGPTLAKQKADSSYIFPFDHTDEKMQYKCKYIYIWIYIIFP